MKESSLIQAGREYMKAIRQAESQGRMTDADKARAQKIVQVLDEILKASPSKNPPIPSND